MALAVAKPLRPEFKHSGENKQMSGIPIRAVEHIFRFHPWKRSQSMLPPTGDGEDRQLEKELDYYRDLWWDHVDKTNGLKGRDPLQAGMVRAGKD
ncbi:MAG: hypothetical protein WC350_02770 [Candidatus Micrarchaeia archaeon]